MQYYCIIGSCYFLLETIFKISETKYKNKNKVASITNITLEKKPEIKRRKKKQVYKKYLFKASKSNIQSSFIQIVCNKSIFFGNRMTMSHLTFTAHNNQRIML